MEEDILQILESIVFNKAMLLVIILVHSSLRV